MNNDRALEKEKIKNSLIKESYKKHYISLLGSITEYERFIDAALDHPRRAIRVNTLKADHDMVVERLKDKGWKLESIPWYNYGYYIEREDRRDIGNIMEHALGYYYIQEPSSMIPSLILDPKPHDIVLDMAAAPGSKTTQMAMMMDNKGLIIANELDYSRIIALKANLERMGVSNTIITNKDARHIRMEGFDKILLDAPCSGTGTLSKSLKSLEMWNPKGLTRLSRLQLSLLVHAYSLLKAGGRLVYSTCSLEVEENEKVLDRFYNMHPGAVSVKPNLFFDNPIMEYNGKIFDNRVSESVRLWPQTCRTDGFFIACITKPLS
ncbi:MAG: NOL1/NOP2/sun family putative RNA methylase [Candidatus Woesearchaeota archaeon]